MPEKSIRIAIVGATGMVGRTALKILHAQRNPSYQLFLYATEKGASRQAKIGEMVYEISPAPSSPPPVDYALFCAPEDAADKMIPAWRKAKIKIIDNSSVFRLHDEVPLVVPEVNPHRIKEADHLIANPNCSTIQLAVALAPIHRRWGLRQVSVATYQSVSGAGADGLLQLRAERIGGKIKNNPFPRKIRANIIPAIGEFDDFGYSREERKMMLELPKILEDSSFYISATTVRVPVTVGHSEAVEFKVGTLISLSELVECLQSAPGVILAKIPEEFHTPLEIEGKDEVYVSRVRFHPQSDSTFLMWVVADNLRKGAATNAIQIMEQWLKSDN